MVRVRQGGARRAGLPCQARSAHCGAAGASAEGASPGEWGSGGAGGGGAGGGAPGVDRTARALAAGGEFGRVALVSGRTATAPSPPPSSLNRSATTASGLGANAGEEASKEAAAMRQVAHAAGVGRLLSSSALTLSFFGSILDGSGLTSGAGVADYAGAADGDAGIAWHDDEVALVPTFVTEAAQLREQHVLVTLRMRAVGGHQLTPRGEGERAFEPTALPLHGPRPGAPAAFATKLLRRTGLPATLRGVLEICDERGNRSPPSPKTRRPSGARRAVLQQRRSARVSRRHEFRKASSQLMGKTSRSEGVAGGSSGCCSRRARRARGGGDGRRSDPSATSVVTTTRRPTTGNDGIFVSPSEEGSEGGPRGCTRALSSPRRAVARRAWRARLDALRRSPRLGRRGGGAARLDRRRRRPRFFCLRL